jgi:imidazolonepropionase-like amidohydrolase
MLAPAKTPRDIVAKLNAEVNRALQSPDVKDRLAKLGTEPMSMTPAEFDRFVADEYRVLGDIMVKAGLTPMQALVAATGGAARVMKLDDQLGTLQPGKRADLLVLRGNPLSDIRNTRQLDAVWIAGREVMR